jgi:hypothetical protein
MPKTFKSERIQLKNVRLSFPSLYERSAFEGNDGPGKYEATFLIDKKDKATVALVRKAIEALLKEAGVKVPENKWCLQDGDGKEYDGYQGMMSVKASSKRRPSTFDKDLSALDSNDDKFYPGCYVNGSIDLWLQDNKYGKRVNANLYGVQFAKDGEAFGENVDVSGDFEAVDDTDLDDLGDDDGDDGLDDL